MSLAGPGPQAVSASGAGAEHATYPVQPSLGAGRCLAVRSSDRTPGQADCVDVVWLPSRASEFFFFDQII